MERIGGDVRLVLRRFAGAEGMAELVRVWPEVVGEAMARNAWPARVARDGTLHVATSSSAWAFELTHLQGEIGDRLAAALGDLAPKRLRFAPGRLPERGPEQPAEGERRVTEPGPVERRRAAEIAATISDEQLRALVARAAAASLATAGSGRSL
jgi:hypothetical protein